LCRYRRKCSRWQRPPHLATGSATGGRVPATGGWVCAHMTANTDAGRRCGRRGADGAGGGAELDRGCTHFGPQQRRRGECFALIRRRAAGAAGSGASA